MKVLHIGLDKNLGGIERFIINLYNNSNNEFDMGLITSTKSLDYSLDELLKDKKYEIYHVNNLKNPFKYVYDIINIINKNNYHIVHIHKNSLANILPIFAAKMSTAKKIIVHSHNTQPSQKGILIKILHALNKKLLSFIKVKKLACSEIAGEWMFCDNFDVIHNAVNINDYIYNSDVEKKIRNKFNLGKAFVIGNVARICEQKNQLFMLDILEEVIKYENNAKLILIGGEDKSIYGKKYYKLVKEKIRMLKLEKNVIMLGCRNDASKFYSVFDVFLMPSIYEGLCIAAIEAQIADIPCVVSDVLPPETCISNKYHTINLCSEKKEWAKKILAYKNNKKSTCGKEIIESSYNIKNEIKSIINVYRY